MPRPPPRSRGGVAAEAKALERAAQLSEDDETRAQRLLKAALAAEAAGWFEHAEALLNDAAELTHNPELRVQAVARRSYLLADRGELDRAYALAIDAAEQAAPRDAALVLCTRRAHAAHAQPRHRCRSGDRRPRLAARRIGA